VNVAIHAGLGWNWPRHRWYPSLAVTAQPHRVNLGVVIPLVPLMAPAAPVAPSGLAADP
jgi:hypothetical protein